MVIDEYKHLVVRLPALGYGTTDFDMSDERRDLLVAGGKKAMARYLDAAATESVSKDATWLGLSAADRIASSIFATEAQPAT